MRHIGRTHGISLAWLHDEIHKPTCILSYIPTHLQAGDIFTKFFPHAKREAWRISRRLINVLSPDEIEELSGGPGGSYEHTPVSAEQPQGCVSTESPEREVVVSRRPKNGPNDSWNYPRRIARKAELLYHFYLSDTPLSPFAAWGGPLHTRRSM